MNTKHIRIPALVLAILILGSVFCFADTPSLISSEPFRLVETTPAEGATNVVQQNVAVKLIFNRDVATDSARQANDGIFKITTTVTDEDGKTTTSTIPYDALYNHDKYPNEVWLLVGEDLVQTQTYVVTIPGTMVSSDGDTLGADQTLTFTIRNAKRDNTVYTVLMLAFMGLMIILTVRDAAKKARGDDGKDAKKAKANASVNPYKEAKKTGKTVEEINAKSAAKKAKIAEKEAKREAMKEEIRKEIEEERKKAKEKSRKKKYRVIRKAPISKAGFSTPEAYKKNK